MVVRTENYADMENDLSEVFNLSKVNFKNEMKQIYDSSDMNKGILVDFTKLYHLIEEWIIKRKIKKIEKIYFYHLTRYSGEYKKCLPLDAGYNTHSSYLN